MKKIDIQIAQYTLKILEKSIYHLEFPDIALLRLIETELLSMLNKGSQMVCLLILPR
jgi:hypothetical protein